MFLNIWSCTAAIRKDKDNWSAHLLKTVVWISKIRHPHTKMMWFMIIYANCAHTVMTYIQALYRCILLSTAAVHTQSIVGGIMCCFKSNLRWVWKGSDPPPPRLPRLLAASTLWPAAPEADAESELKLDIGTLWMHHYNLGGRVTPDIVTDRGALMCQCTTCHESFTMMFDLLFLPMM